MKKIFGGLFFVAGVALFFASCNDGIDYEKIRMEELALLQRYIDQEYPGEEPTSSGLYYFNEEGTGVVEDSIKLGDRVQIYYATWLLGEDADGVLDSLLVDQSSGYISGHRYEPNTYIVGTSDPNFKAIAGLEEAFLYMHPGTKSHLVINSELAYGQNGVPSGGIGMFKTILMEVEVYKVISSETPTE